MDYVASPHLNVRIPEDLLAELRVEAAKADRTLAWYVTRVLRDRANASESREFLLSFEGRIDALEDAAFERKR